MKAYINKIATIGIVFLVIIACQKDDAIPQYNFSDALATLVIKEFKETILLLLRIYLKELLAEPGPYHNQHQ